MLDCGVPSAISIRQSAISHQPSATSQELEMLALEEECLLIAGR
jgi:hypothetical protein